MSKSPSNLPAPAFDDPKHNLRIYQGDCLEILAAIPENYVDLVFADPPYFLSNGGITCYAGKMVSVNKGDWDKSRGPDANHEFNTAWLAACQRLLKPNGSIWVSGTSHVIHSVGYAMQQLGFKLLNDLSWGKTNQPHNFPPPLLPPPPQTLNLGHQKQKGPPHLPLQADARPRRRQADEKRLGNF